MLLRYNAWVGSVSVTTELLYQGVPYPVLREPGIFEEESVNPNVSSVFTIMQPFWRYIK
jgi:hypothetical protein